MQVFVAEKYLEYDILYTLKKSISDSGFSFWFRNTWCCLEVPLEMMSQTLPCGSLIQVRIYRPETKVKHKEFFIHSRAMSPQSCGSFVSLMLKTSDCHLLIWIVFVIQFQMSSMYGKFPVSPDFLSPVRGDIIPLSYTTTSCMFTVDISTLKGAAPRCGPSMLVGCLKIKPWVCFMENKS